MNAASSSAVALLPPPSSSVIPEMTDPMGKNWVQPRREDIEIDDTHALMTTRVMEQLADYSASMPGGVYPGKMWRRQKVRGDESQGWWLCWYGHSDDPKFCSNHYREILLYC